MARQAAPCNTWGMAKFKMIAFPIAAGTLAFSIAAWHLAESGDPFLIAVFAASSVGVAAGGIVALGYWVAKR